ncbi:MAG: O-methyltransferase [Saprospiraceae bacterium]
MNNEEKRLQYCLRHSTPPGPLLQALERETHLSTLNPQMLAGPLQGMLLKMICQMLRPMLVLEIGTFTGYSALCMADGLPDGSRVHTIEANDELAPIIQKHLRLSRVEDRVVLHIGKAENIVPNLDDNFDLVFLDGGKLDYARHYALTFPKLRPGGFLLADNVLWDGKVLQNGPTDAAAEALGAFNALVQADERAENLLLPLRDGLMLVRKK